MCFLENDKNFLLAVLAHDDTVSLSFTARQIG